MNNMKILIHDERSDALEFVLDGIVNHGFNAGIAKDGPAAIGMLSDERYDVILTNGSYEKIDLDQYCRITSKALFVIDIKNTRKENEAMGLNVDLCLHRPFEASKLWQTIASHVFNT